MTSSTFPRVLVANRGEIAVRIMRTLRRMGISPVAVYSDADRHEPHVSLADRAVHLGAAPARDSYLRIDRIIDAALATGARAVHPGYGFLSEQPALARACAAAGLVFIGPSAEAIEAMGDKIVAKRTVQAAGVPVLPGRLERGMDDAALTAAAHEIGFPVLVKPSAGGGGKGMVVVRSADGLADAIAAARRAALGAFGDDTLFVERFVERPRHIEIQVLADHHGTVVHLGERECSLQRRHQKIIEEAPSPFVTPAVREALGATAVAAARAVGYVGAGTVEFIMSGDRPDEFFFLEMNTRLQVEHPVTELVHGIDLVEWQLRVAAGEALGFSQDDLVPSGHAVEARIYAEQPARGFVPTGGTVVDVLEPAGDSVRVDSGIGPGSVVTRHYDPMLAKVIAHGRTRDEALDRLDAALRGHSVIGVETNTGFLRALLAHPEVRAGRLDTGLVERDLPMLVDEAAGPPPAAVLTAAVSSLIDDLDHPDPWRACIGWRLGGRAWCTETWEHAAGGRHTVRLRPRPGSPTWDARCDDGAPTTVALHLDHRGHGTVTLAGVTERVVVRSSGPATWVVLDGTAWELRRHDPLDDRLRTEHRGAGHGVVRSPMPGIVLSVVEPGVTVSAGQRLAVVEAMKMEHQLRAPFDGRVSAVHVRTGQAVALDEPLLEVSEHDAIVDQTTEEPTG